SGLRCVSHTRSDPRSSGASHKNRFHRFLVSAPCDVSLCRATPPLAPCIPTKKYESIKSGAAVTAVGIYVIEGDVTDLAVARAFGGRVCRA
ncbi:MAG: hypothetical protein ACPIOQ_05495, partial [Promethearchaeia archaeon]